MLHSYCAEVALVHSEADLLDVLATYACLHQMTMVQALLYKYKCREVARAYGDKNEAQMAGKVSRLLSARIFIQ